MDRPCRATLHRFELSILMNDHLTTTNLIISYGNQPNNIKFIFGQFFVESQLKSGLVLCLHISICSINLLDSRFILIN